MPARLWPIVLAAFLAGCVNDAFLPTSTDPPGSVEPGDLAPGQLVDPKTPGQLKGVVTNEALVPIKGANVTLLASNKTFLTQEDGAFKFTELPNGRLLAYAQAEGFFGKTQAATIRNGTIVTLDFRLAAIPVVEPYAESIEFGGLISCDGMFLLPSGVQEVHCGTADPNDARVFETDVKAAVKAIVVEVKWDAASPGTRALRARLETVGFGASDTVLANATGPSVLRLEVPRPPLEKYYPGGGTVRVVVGPAPSVSDEEAELDAGLAVQQQFTVVLTAFYHEGAPDGFSVFDEA